MNTTLEEQNKRYEDNLRDLRNTIKTNNDEIITKTKDNGENINHKVDTKIEIKINIMKRKGNPENNNDKK